MRRHLSLRFVSIPRPKALLSFRARQNSTLAFSRQAQKEFRPYENRVSFTYLSELPLEQLLAKLSQLPPRDIVLFVTMFRDGIGHPFVPHEVVERVSSAASVPVYGFVDQYLGRGIVGGSLYSFTTHGAETAKMVLRLLTGAVPPQKLFRSLQQQD